MNRKKEERNKLICDLYHDGKTIREISEIIKLKKAPLMTILQRDYNLYYTDAFISPSEKIKIKSAGIDDEKHGKLGDMYIITNVIIPNKLDREQKALFKELADTALDNNDAFKKMRKFL